MLDFHAERVRDYARQATTQDLLDRVTVFREGMEPEALDIFEAELRSRGIFVPQIEAHASQREGEVLRGRDGTAATCHRCGRPAVQGRWGWHRLGGLLPLFPRYLYTCAEHTAPGRSSAPSA